MARKFLTAIDLNKNQIQQAVLQLLGSDPSSPVEAQFYYDSTAKRLKYHNGTAFVTDTDRSRHTGQQAASTISDFDTQVRTSRLDQMAAPTAAVSLNGQKLTNSGAASANSDVPNWGQVQTAIDNARAGLSVKDPVRVAAQGNVNLSAPGANIDGVAMSAGQRFLAPLQTTTSQNGIYVWNGAAVAATRATDADSEGEVIDGTIVAVQEGTDQGRQYIQRATSTGAPGTWSQDWGLYTTGGATYTNGNGLDLTGNSFSVKPVAGGNITVGASGVDVDTSKVVRKYATTFGDNSAVSIPITHNLNTQDVTVSVREVATNAFVECDIVATSVNVVTLGFAAAPATNSLRVVVHG